jgi:hypothetical protein
MVVNNLGETILDLRFIPSFSYLVSIRYVSLVVSCMSRACMVLLACQPRIKTKILAYCFFSVGLDWYQLAGWARLYVRALSWFCTAAPRVLNENSEMG